MNVGLPTTGIGGVFYIISALIMFGIELFRIVTGKHESKRLKGVLILVTLSALIVSTFYLTGMFFSNVLSVDTTNDTASIAALNAGILPYTAYILSSPIIVLVLVLSIFTIIGKTMNFLDKKIALD